MPSFQLPDLLTQRVRHYVLYPSWILTLAAIVISIFGIQLSITVQLVPLAISAVFLGLPHGAVDHLVPGQLRKRPLSRREMAELLAVYVMLIAAVFVLWRLAPALGFVFFILMTWLHWGLGDLFAHLQFVGYRSLPGRLERSVTALMRGALPMLLPLIAFPDDFQLTATTIIGLVSAADGTSIEGFFSLEMRSLVAIGLVFLIFAGLILTYRAAKQKQAKREWLTYAGETALLTLYFAVVPPFLAIGLYFCAWHSLRHIARLMLIDQHSRQAIERQQPITAFGHFMRQALPTTLIALTMIVVILVVVPGGLDDILSSAAIYLMVIAALTLPHTVIVTWMDAAQGVWRVSKFAAQANMVDQQAAAPISSK